MPAHPHLWFEREEPTKPKKSLGFPRTTPPADIPAHARRLEVSLRSAIDSSKKEEPGYDERLLFKLNVGSLSPELLETGFRGVEVVSQEEGGVALIFANENALSVFEARLTTLIQGGTPQYKEILYALEAFDSFKPEDRMGWALKREGVPQTSQFILDVELWPLGQEKERSKLQASFEQALQQQQVVILDKVSSTGYLAYRVRVSPQQANWLLRYRDIRTVDLPPKYHLDQQVYKLDIQDVQDVNAPPIDSPVLAILDSGIATSHPLLASAIGDAQGFVHPDKYSFDENGHGTSIAGISLYDDVEEAALSKTFIPQFRILSGRILDKNADGNPRFIENIIQEAVDYFKDNYSCKLFNLSYGDQNKPFNGGRIRGLAYTLDRISRESGVLFIVPTGNITECDSTTLKSYPEYLTNGIFPILDPAPALNVLTVGSLARYNATHAAIRYPNDVPHKPIAEVNQPSPFGRCSSSIKGAVKPELVHYGGNLAVDHRHNSIVYKGLGELSTCVDFSNGSLFREDYGTSYAAPHIAHLAARVLLELPNSSNNLLRAILVANARIPKACYELLESDGDTQSKVEERLSKTVGYGLVNTVYLYKSTEENVALLAEDTIVNKHNHFYEVPIPSSLYNSGKKTRSREISVALAHCPQTRTTRVEYKASRIYFRLAEASSLDEAVAAYSKAAEDEEQQDGIGELSTNRHTYGASKRSHGTVQASSWVIKRPRKNKLFVIVTRNDFAWGEPLSKENEEYSLVIRIADRENVDARLYTEIRTQLQARQRERQRVRVATQ